jgi:N-acyl-D-aspartate/D-glutamate deacylase
MEHTDVPSQFGWMREFVTRSGGTVSFNFSQPRHAPEIWRDVLCELEAASNDGFDIVGQVAGRSIGVLECLEGTVHPFALHQAFQPLAGLTHDERVHALHNPEIVESLLAETLPPITPVVDLLTSGWERMYPVLTETIDYEPDPGTDSLAALARRSGESPQFHALQTLLSNNGTGMLYVPLFNYSSGNLDLVYDLHEHPNTRLGLSDAGAHCGSICDGGMPTFMLTHWTRDRTRGPKVALEEMVRRQTSETARLFGLFDRGVIRAGMKADLNLIDYDRLGFSAATMAYDLPTGARRLVQRGLGYAMTMVSGLVTVEDDEFTGVLPGAVLRGGTSAPR